MSDKMKDTPFSFKIAAIHGLIFTGIFILYGLVKVVLSFMDRDYSNIKNYILLAVIGLALISIVKAYWDRKKWGWYGLLGLNGLIILNVMIDYRSVEDLVILFASLGAVYFLLTPTTKRFLVK